ncbi:MAG: hypothetical protein A2Y38_13145 [Spirochaetes bacterium GWB1_59_5]|nr:MAG: hypothetical protein A2Y38_13145 [Spirochaetes bacterium GWB1_59_5]
MRKIAGLMLLIVSMSLTGAFAMPGTKTLPGRYAMGVTSEELLAAVPTAADKTPQEWTLEERLAIASVFSVAMQESMYVRRAGMVSFLLPGAGQFMTGQTGAGALHLGAELLIAGAAVAGVWYLTPDDLLDHSLTRDERHAVMVSYMTPERIGELLPGMGVAAGTWVLSMVNRSLAAHGAARGALANLADGTVSFEPVVGLNSIGGGLRVRFH